MAVMDRGPVVIRRRLGSGLKELRVQKGYQLDRVAKELEMSSAKLSRLETGQVAPKVRDVRDLLEEYDAPEDVRRQLMDWADVAKEPGWWQPYTATVPGDLNLYVSLEAEAAELKIFIPSVPALLQTAAYADAAVRGRAPHNTDTQVGELVRIILQRQTILRTDRERVPPLRLHVVMDEAALLRGPLEGDLMAEQLRELAQRAAEDTITVQVYPFTAGFTEAISSFSIFEPRDSTDLPVVCEESTGGDAFHDGHTELLRYRAIWNELTTHAQSEDESLRTIKRAAETWERAHPEISQ